MAPAPTPEILGPPPWPLRLSELHGRTHALTMVVAPHPGALAAVRERYSRRDIVVLSTAPSTVEAALLVEAGADAYLTDLAELEPALAALRAGQAWLSAVAAAAVCRLARLPGDCAFDQLAAAARLAAAGRPWPTVCHTVGIADTRATLAALRVAL